MAAEKFTAITKMLAQNQERTPIKIEKLIAFWDSLTEDEWKAADKEAEQLVKMLETRAGGYYTQFPTIFSRSMQFPTPPTISEQQYTSSREKFITLLRSYAEMYNIHMNAHVLTFGRRAGDKNIRQFSAELLDKCKKKYKTALPAPKKPASTIADKLGINKWDMGGPTISSLSTGAHSSAISSVTVPLVQQPLIQAQLECAATLNVLGDEEASSYLTQLNGLELNYKNLRAETPVEFAPYFFNLLNTQLEAIFLAMINVSSGLINHEKSTSLGKGAKVFQKITDLIAAIAANIPGVGIAMGITKFALGIVDQVDHDRVTNNMKQIVQLVASDQFKMLSYRLAKYLTEAYLYQLGNVQFENGVVKRTINKVEETLRIASPKDAVQVFAEYIIAKLLSAMVVGELHIAPTQKDPEERLDELFNGMYNLITTTPDPKGKLSQVFAKIGEVIVSTKISFKGEKITSLDDILCRATVITPQGYYVYTKDKAHYDIGHLGYVQLSEENAVRRTKSDATLKRTPSLSALNPPLTYPLFSLFAPPRQKYYQTFPVVVEELRETQTQLKHSQHELVALKLRLDNLERLVQPIAPLVASPPPVSATPPVPPVSAESGTPTSSGPSLDRHHSPRK